MNKNRLKDYLFNLHKENTADYLKKNNLWHLLNTDDPRFVLINKILQKKQKQLNVYVLNEMNSLQKYCDEHNISNICVKGLTLAHQLYEQPEDRIFDDIDLFIEPDKLYLMSQYLIDNGYADENGIPVTNQSVFDYYHPTHLSVFTKENIALEIHVMPFYTNTISNNLLGAKEIDFFYDTREFVCVEGIKFPVLEKHLNALFLLDHFIKHITFYVKDYTRLGTFQLHIELNKLVEAARFIETFEIEQDKLFTLAKQYNSVPTLMLALKYLNEILEMNFVLSEDIEVYIDALPIFENKLIGELYKLTLKDVLLNENNPMFFEKLIDRFSFTPSYILKVPEKSPGVCGVKFGIDVDSPNNLFGTHFKQRTHDEEQPIFKMSGTMNWDKAGLNVSMMMVDKTFPDADGNLIEFSFFKNIQIPYRNEILYVRMLLNPEGDTYVYYDYVYKQQDGIETQKRSLSNVQFTGILGEGYAVSFSVPWNILEINPVKGQRLLFELCIQSKNRKTICDRINLGSIDKELDPYSYSILELVEPIKFLYEEP